LRQARAEGGLGDAYYQQGAMLTAFEHYDRCVQLGEAHRHPSVVPANLAMRALTLQYQNCLAEAVADCERAIDLAGRSANVRHQLLAHNVLAGVETFRGRPEAGLDHARQTLALSRRIGSRRFALDALSQIAHLSWVAGRIPQAREALEEADGLLDATMSAFGGAYVRGLQAACAEDAAARDTFLHEGERLLGRHAVSHCHVYFYMTAIEIGLISGNAEQVLRFAAALERYTAKEPLPFTDIFIRRARCLVADDADERESLVAQARAAGLGTGLRLLTPGTR
jgi:tetratricopeptide (TPR) repeat protein